MKVGSEIMFLVTERLRPRGAGWILVSGIWVRLVGGGLEMTGEVSKIGGVELAEYGVRGEGLFDSDGAIPPVCRGLSDLLSK